MKDKIFLTVGEQKVVTDIEATNGPGGIVIKLGTDTFIEISAKNFGRLVASVAAVAWQKPLPPQPLPETTNACPKCLSVKGYCPADMVDIGVGMEKCGPAHCEECGWVELSFDDLLSSLHNTKR